MPKDKPTWYMVDLRAVAQLTKPVSLAEIKQMVNEMLKFNQSYLPTFKHFEA